MKNNIAISVENVVKTYKLYDRHADRVKETFHPFRKKYHHPFNALNNISFQIEKGETVGIIGKNGSGKSTILQIICGILSPTSGTVDVSGRVSALLELGAGFNPEFTGRQNIYMNGAILGINKKKIEACFDDIARFAEIGDYIDQPVKTYSSGMYIRLAFAVAVNVNPDILIVDEVLAVGDVRFQMKCIEKMKSYQEQGKTILFVTHAIELTKRFCNRSIWIENGKIRLNGDTNVVADTYLDFMCSQSESNKKASVPIMNKKVLPARILKIKIMNSENNETNSFQKGTDILLVITYEIFDEVIEDILLGIAILDRNNTYVYGPNTYLDNFSIPTKVGKHKILYRLKNIPLFGGTYFFDVGLFTEKGVVCIDYKTKFGKVFIYSDYLAEGLCELEHEWELVK